MFLRLEKSVIHHISRSNNAHRVSLVACFSKQVCASDKKWTEGLVRGAERKQVMKKLRQGATAPAQAHGSPLDSLAMFVKV